MSDFEVYLWMVLGVAVAVVFPVLRNLMTKYWPARGAGGVPNWVKKYGILALFSAVTGVVLLAIIRSQGDAIDEWWSAFLIGFAWESTIEKVGGKSSDTL